MRREEEGNGAYMLLADGTLRLTDEQQKLLVHTARVLTGMVVRLVAMNPAEAAVAWLTAVEPALHFEPVPITKQDFHQFAARHGYTKSRAGRAWARVYHTSSRRSQPEEHRGLPAIRYLGFAGKPPYGVSDERLLDLRSVFDRLVAGEFRHEVWYEATKADVNFLIHLVNEWMHLEPPLGFV